MFCVTLTDLDHSKMPAKTYIFTTELCSCTLGTVQADKPYVSRQVIQFQFCLETLGYKEYLKQSLDIKVSW